MTPAMRRALTDDEIMAWWRAAMLGQSPVVTDEPHAGWYKRRLVKDGPWVPVRIWLHQEVDEAGELAADAYFCCDVDGKPADPEQHWLFACMQPIAETDYTHLLRLSRYAKKHDDREPLANPRKAIDLLNVPPPEFKRRRRP